jgi:hypothetical protein
LQNTNGKKEEQNKLEFGIQSRGEVYRNPFLGKKIRPEGLIFFFFQACSNGYEDC